MPVLGGGEDQGQHFVDVLLDVVVLDSQDTEATRRDDRVTGGIVVGLVVVNGAIDLDDQAQGVAVEVGNEAVDDLLAAEVKAVEAIGAQPLPQRALRWRHLAAQFPRPLELGLIDALAGDEVVGQGTSPLAPPRRGEGN